MLPSYRYYDVEGTSPLTLDKSVGKPLRDYKIYGNSVQEGTPSPDNPVEVQSVGDKSKNLLDISSLVHYDNSRNIRTTKTDNNLVVHSSESQTYVYIPSDKSKKGLFDRLKPSTTYRLKYSSRYLEGEPTPSQSRIIFINSSSVAKLTFYIQKPTTIGQIVTLSTTFKTPADMSEYDKILIYGAYGNGSRTEIIDWIVTEETETVEPYEPYGYKIPIEVGGKNLVDMSKVSRSYLNQSGEVLNSGGFQTSDFIDVSNISNISISSAKSYAFYDEEKVFISGETKSMTIFRSYTIPENAKYIRFDWQTESVNGDIVYAFAGGYTEDTFPLYESYKEPIKTNIYLDEPLADGEYIDFKNQKIVKADNEVNIALPELKTHKGTNVISVDTEIQPSNMQIQYYK